MPSAGRLPKMGEREGDRASVGASKKLNCKLFKSFAADKSREQLEHCCVQTAHKLARGFKCRYIARDTAADTDTFRI